MKDELRLEIALMFFDESATRRTIGYLHSTKFECMIVAIACLAFAVAFDLSLPLWFPEPDVAEYYSTLFHMVAGTGCFVALCLLCMAYQNHRDQKLEEVKLTLNKREDFN